MTKLQTIRLTYSELAEKLGVSLEAAKQRVRRGGWRRETGNDGQVYAWVPEEALKITGKPTSNATDVVATEPERSHDIATTTVLIQALQAATERADKAEQIARDAITKAGESEARAAIAETQANRAENDITELRRRYECSGLSGRIIRFLAGN